MIGRLSGKIIETTPDGLVLIEVGGVGYEVNVPAPVLAALRPGSQETAVLFTHLAVREDGAALFGFPSRVQLLVFKMLLGVKNIGPKNAMSILSAMKPEEVASALQREDVARFKAVPGIGRKTAELIIVELKDKVRKMNIVLPPEAPALGGKLREVASALLNLGFRPQDVQKTVEGLRGLDEKGAGVEEIIREALARLAR